MSAPIQLALPALLDQRKKIQPFLLARIRENLRELERQLALQSSCELLRLEGGWCGVLHVPASQADEYLAVDLLRKQNVLVHPGHFYDFPRDGYLIFSLIIPPDEFREGIERLLRHFS